MRLIIAGSRTIDGEAAYQNLRQFIRGSLKCKPAEIVSGGAKGVDLLGERFADEHNIPVKRFTPDWDKHGKGAGFLRNGDMAVYASDAPGSALVAYWDGVSRGTQQMIEVAKTYGLQVLVLRTESDTITVKDVTPEIFPQSHSSLNTFKTCPRQYEAKYVVRDVKFVQNDAAKWGDEVHIALENFIKRTTPLPGNMVQYQPALDWVMKRAENGQGVVLAERKSAVEQVAKAPVSYSSKDAWLRAKIDVTILYEGRCVAEVFDWKTGKPKDDDTQLLLYAGCTLADYRSVNQVKSGYIWLQTMQPSKPLTVDRADYYENWRPFEQTYGDLVRAYQTGVFPPKPSGLCNGWCDVTRCEFWKPKQARR